MSSAFRQEIKQDNVINVFFFLGRERGREGREGERKEGREGGEGEGERGRMIQGM